MPEAKAETLALIEGLVHEQRTFPPSDEFRRGALIADEAVYREAETDFEAFWSRLAREFVAWYREPTQGLAWDPPHCTWFADGELNASHGCLDRHVEAGRGAKVAYHWVGEPPGETRDVTYADLLRDVSRLANGLRSLGVRKGDRVGIYMGMVPEVAVAMLACARIGAPHIVVFGGFSADSLAERLRDTGATVLITQDEGWRKGGAVPLKANADQACARAPDVRHVRRLPADGQPGPLGDARRLVARAVRRRCPTNASPSAWGPRTPSSCCTPPVRRRSRRERCTRPAATSCTPR